MKKRSFVGGEHSRPRLAQFAILFFFTLLAATSNGLRAQDRADEERFRSHIASGEFGVAQSILHAQDDAGVRDVWRAELASALASVGAYSHAANISGQIQDDLARSQSLGSIQSSEFDSGNAGRAGGGSIADFDSLIELIQTTVAPDSWDAVGGPGSIAPFASGVYVDTEGTLLRVRTPDGDDALSGLWLDSKVSDGNGDPRKKSRLRKVSLTRLERKLQICAALGEKPSDAMRNFAGITRIKYLFVYPDTGDVVVAGPANEWAPGFEGRNVDIETGAPTIQLDDFVVCLRNNLDRGGKFGCSIDPRRENLAATSEFMSSSTLTGEAYRNKLRETLGLQRISVHGIDASSRVARVIVEADYRMKLVGMGLEKGTLGVPSYLDSIEIGADGSDSPADVVRWWFTPNYDSISVTKGKTGYELIGRGVKVLSENELLTETGRRVGTGRANIPAQEFAHGFTDNVEAMGQKYPIYAELRNVFDLAMVSSLICNEGIAERVDWNMTYFGSMRDGQNVTSHATSNHDVPTQVESVLNHRVVERLKGGRRLRHTLIGISGGVVVNTGQSAISRLIREDKYGLIDAERDTARPVAETNAWWWD